MKVKVISSDAQQEKEKWDQFLLKNKARFTQSFDWGEFQKSQRKRVFRLAVTKGGQKTAQIQILEETFPMQKKLLYVPFGPVFSQESSLLEQDKTFAAILEKIKEIGQDHRAIFLTLEATQPYPKFPDEFINYPAAKRFQPRKTIWVDLQKSEKEILRSFHSQTRYNIRVSQRKGLKLEIYDPSEGPKKLNEFVQLIKKTSQRKKFQTYPGSYYQQMVKILDDSPKVELLLAKYQQQIVGGSMIMLFGKKASSLHGATDYEQRSLKISDFLQWQKIQRAKKAGCKILDLWGIDEKKWPGITYFKKGFDGQIIKYPEGRDVILRPGWYKLYRLYKKLKIN